MINKLIYSVGAKIRNPNIFHHYSFLKKTESWSINELENYQLNRLKKLIEFAYEYSNYYNQLFNSIKLVPKDISNLADLRKIPTIDKNTLIKENSRIRTEFQFKKSFFSETSGSSGQVLKFYKDENWDSFNRASIMRGYSWYNVKPWERNGYFWGYNISPNKRWKIKLLDALQNRFRVFTYDEEDIKHFAKKLQKASYVEGYSSMIYEVAKIINSSDDIKNLHFDLKMVKGTSEKIFESYQPEVKKAFGQKLISEYGAAESGIIAFECPEGNMHINMEGVIVEEIENEIVVTNLLSKSFPIIRYKLGDYIKMKPKNYRCSCGMKHPVIESVLGRVGKLIYGKKHSYPSLTFYYVFKNIALNDKIELNYQAIQEKIGELLIYIEQSIDKNIYDLIEREMIKYFKTDIDYHIMDNQVLHQKNGKLMDFMSKIN